ncbi:hypothetical protein ACP4OV_019685 [Aristida adscensionis]
MIDSGRDYTVLGKCVKEILSQIKPEDDDKNKRLHAIKELENCMHSVAALKGAAVKPFGSFVSELYSKSGDLDLSVQISNASNLPMNKKKKQNVLRDVRRALLTRGVAGYMQFIPHARVPVLQYESKLFSISCDISIDNYAGRIKSKIFYWVNTLDERFGDMVLLMKEWAKAQDINDPKSGSLNSYSLCLLVLFHFQTCEPPILPPLKEIYEGNITDDITAWFIHINALPDDVISTYTGQFERIQDDPSRMTKSYKLFVEDPVERPENAARAVSMRGLQQIAIAFNNAYRKFDSLEHADRNELLELLCTPNVCSKLGVRVKANTHTKAAQRNHQQTRSMRRQEHDQRLQEPRGLTGSRPVHQIQQANNATHRVTAQYQNRNHPQVYTTVRQNAVSYLNHNHPQPYSTGHQRATYHTGSYQNRNHPHAYSTGHQTAPYHNNHNHPHAYTPLQQTASQQNHDHQQFYTTGFQTVVPYSSHNQGITGFQTAGSYQNQNQQLYASGLLAPVLYQNQQRMREYTSNHQGNRHAATARYKPVRGQFYNGSTPESQSQASNSAALQR